MKAVQLAPGDPRPEHGSVVDLPERPDLTTQQVKAARNKAIKAMRIAGFSTAIIGLFFNLTAQRVGQISNGSS